MARIKLPTMSYKEIGEKGARYALDEVEYNGLTIRQWADKITSGNYAPVVHGRMKKSGEYTVERYQYKIVEEKCSVCEHYSIRFKHKSESNFCPRCGAKMDKEANHDD